MISDIMVLKKNAYSLIILILVGTFAIRKSILIPG